MDTLQCAVVLAKFERFDWEVTRRREIGARYSELLKAIPGIRVLELRPDRTSVYAQHTPYSRRIAAAWRQHYGRAAFPLPFITRFRCTGSLRVRQYGLEARLPVSDDLADHVISLPMYPDLDPALQDDIVDAVRRSVA